MFTALLALPAFQDGPGLGGRFFENTLTAGINERFWNGSLNGGTIRPWNGLARLSGTSEHYPFLRSKPGMLPAGGDWNASVDFSCATINVCGTGIGVSTLSTGRDLLRVHIDRTQGAIQLYRGDDAKDQPGSAWKGDPLKVAVGFPSPVQRYVVEKRGDHLTLVYNGVRLITVASPGEVALRLGSERLDTKAPGPWSELAIGSVRVDYLTGPLPQGLR